MTKLLAIKRLDLEDPRQAMVSARSYIRQLIYDGILPAGTIISQVELASALGVSRTPLREALRMLQEEGLIIAEANRRCRIAGFSPEDLDSVYAARLMLEALAMKISLPLLREIEVKVLEQSLERMEAVEHEIRSGNEEHFDIWLGAHRAFHVTMVSKAPAPLIEQIRAQIIRCERYLIGMVTARPLGSIAREGEHRALLGKIKSRKFDDVVIDNAKHRARTAVLVLAEAAFEFDPVAIRVALKMITADAEATSPMALVGSISSRANGHFADSGSHVAS